MNKKIIVAVVALMAMFSINANAQNVMDRGNSLITVGVGITNDHIPLSVAYDYGIVGNLFDSPDASLSFGGMLGTSFGKYYNAIFVGPRLGLHYHFIPQLDTYISLMLGLNAGRFSNSVNDANINTQWNTGLGWGTHVGARYMFTPKVGAFVEFGYGYSFANIGLAFKL